MVAGYKQLAVIERVFRDLKHLVDIRPVNHRLESRIRAHVLLCWLAILLIRVTENEVQQTWFQLKKILSTIQVGILQLPEGKIHQSNSLSTQQKALFKRLKLDLPPKFFQIDAH